MHTSSLGPATCHTPPPPNNGSMHTRVRVQVPPPHATLQLENGDTLRPPGVGCHVTPVPRVSTVHVTRRSTTCGAAHRPHPGRAVGRRDGCRVLCLNTTAEEWSTNHQHVQLRGTQQLPRVTPNAQSVFRHSVRGLDSVMVAVKNPGKYHSVSAFAPISSPTQVCASCDCACEFTPLHVVYGTHHIAHHTHPGFTHIKSRQGQDLTESAVKYDGPA